MDYRLEVSTYFVPIFNRLWLFSTGSLAMKVSHAYAHLLAPKEFKNTPNQSRVSTRKLQEDCLELSLQSSKTWRLELHRHGHRLYQCKNPYAQSICPPGCMKGRPAGCVSLYLSLGVRQLPPHTPIYLPIFLH